MNVLYIANLIPYPLDGGGKIFTYSTIQALAKENDVDLLCFYEHEDIQAGKKELKKYCSSIEVLPIKVTTRENVLLMMAKAALSLFSSRPLAISKYISSAMKERIKIKLQSKKYDCVFLNLLAMYTYAEYIRKIDSKIKVVLYEQNCEALIYRRLLEQTRHPIKKLFITLEAKKLARFENNAIRNVDELILLSKEDQEALGLDGCKCNVIPIGINPPMMQKSYDKRDSKKIKLLFVGTMTWAPNNEGIIWFLENVMPLCKDSNLYELYIIGKKPSEAVSRLCKEFSNVYLMGYVESVEEYYEKCDVLVVPLFVGGGQRVKIIEALGRGFAVISTTIGAEGLKYKDGETLLIANDEATFKEKIDSCFSTDLLTKIGQGGKCVFDSEYSTLIIEKKINGVLRKLMTP